MEFKYQNEMSHVANCPPIGVHQAITCYRFVHNPMGKTCFDPAARVTPDRFLGTEIPCNAYALSLFTNEARARKAYRRNVDKYQGFAKLAGDHLAVGDLTADDGRQTKPDRNGHFSLYESEDADLAPQFKIVADLKC